MNVKEWQRVYPVYPKFVSQPEGFSNKSTNACGTLSCSIFECRIKVYICMYVSVGLSWFVMVCPKMWVYSIATYINENMIVNHQIVGAVGS